ncbi:MAG: methyltransferase domain-containing protein [Planctomycetota bacterium]
MRCLVCSSADLDVFFDAGEQPVFANVLYDTREEALAAPTGRIRLGACPVCGFVHNVDFDPELVAYAPGYENSLHGSPTFQAFASELSAGLVERHQLRGGRAVEIGGGRAEFMRELLDAGLSEGLVMDPSSPDDALASGDALRIERRLFEHGDVHGGDHPTRLLLTRHVLEHINAPGDFVGLLSGAARDAGAGLYVEVPNGLWTLRDLGVWDVIYEHCSYFTPHALAALCARYGAVGESRECYGGQFLALEAPSIGPEAPLDASELAADPAEARMRSRFGDTFGEIEGRWKSRLSAARDKGERIAIWGAGSKGATFLNTMDAPDVIVCAIDVNARKLGRFIPGTGHQILGPDSIRDADLHEIVVMNPLYREEIARMASDSGSSAVVTVV